MNPKVYLSIKHIFHQSTYKGRINQPERYSQSSALIALCERNPTLSWRSPSGEIFSIRLIKCTICYVCWKQNKQLYANRVSSALFCKLPKCAVFPMWFRKRCLILSACASPRITHSAMGHGPLYYNGLTSIPAWINNHIPSKVWDEITYPFTNFNVQPLFGNYD